MNSGFKDSAEPQAQKRKRDEHEHAEPKLKGKKARQDRSPSVDETPASPVSVSSAVGNRDPADCPRSASGFSEV
ncbi:hypothetical protein SERLA73DRAFT_141786, partial [Serpula lacrymans var. lacrymans S7.3]